MVTTVVGQGVDRHRVTWHRRIGGASVPGGLVRQSENGFAVCGPDRHTARTIAARHAVALCPDASSLLGDCAMDDSAGHAWKHVTVLASGLAVDGLIRLR